MPCISNHHRLREWTYSTPLPARTGKRGVPGPRPGKGCDGTKGVKDRHELKIKTSLQTVHAAIRAYSYINIYIIIKKNFFF